MLPLYILRIASVVYQHTIRRDGFLILFPSPLPLFPQPGEYIAFGLSGSSTDALMPGSDVVWTWLDNSGVHAGQLDINRYAQVTELIHSYFNHLHVHVHVCTLLGTVHVHVQVYNSPGTHFPPLVSLSPTVCALKQDWGVS